jgi:ribonuclease PH
MSRIDGRADDELRPVRFITDFITYPEGSVLIKTGGTRVLCNVSVEAKVPAWREASGGGWLTAEYAMLPRATHTRTPRSAGTEGARSILLDLATEGIAQLIKNQAEALAEAGVQ